MEHHMNLISNILNSPHHHWFLFFKRKRPDNYNIYNNNSSSSSNGDHRIYDNELSEGYLYDPCERAWYQLTLQLPTGSIPAASSGGLITVISDDPGCKRLSVCNPLTQALVRLPPTLTPRLCPLVGLFATDNFFHVMVAGDNLIDNLAVKNSTTESFHVDRSTGFYSMWSTTSVLPKNTNFESGRMIFVDGVFYSISYKPFCMLAQNISTGDWSEINIPMKRNLRSPSLVECQGRLFFVAAIEKAKLVVPKTVRVWAWRNGTWGTKPVDVMPQQIYQQFIEVENGNGFECIGHGDFIAFIISGSQSILFFNVDQKTWEWIPPCPFLATADQLCGFAYEPRPVTQIMGVLSFFDQPVYPGQSSNS